MQKPEEIAYELLELSQKEKRKYLVRILSKEFIVYPGVFSPKYLNDTELFAKHLPYKEVSNVRNWHWCRSHCHYHDS